MFKSLFPFGISPWIEYFKLRKIAKVVGKILLGFAISMVMMYLIFFTPIAFIAAFLLLFYAMGAVWFQ